MFMPVSIGTVVDGNELDQLDPEIKASGLSRSFPRDLPVEEIADQRHHHIRFVFECEMAGIEQVQLGVRQIAKVGSRAIGREDLVVLAPNDQCRRLMPPEPFLHLRIERQVGSIIIEDVQLYIVVAGPIEEWLVVRPPEELLTELEAARPIPMAAEEIPVGLPSDLLRRRPDIRAAERRIAAANARIGVATADLYPHFFLTGLGGLESLHADTFLNPSAGYFSIGPNVSWPVFDAGRVRFNIDAERARTDQTVAACERTVLTALQDAETALVRNGKAEDRRRFLEAERSANAQAVTVATQLYGQGLRDFIRVLVAEQSLATTGEKLAASETETALTLVALCKSLGGGWQ